MDDDNLNKNYYLMKEKNSNYQLFDYKCIYYFYNYNIINKIANHDEKIKKHLDQNLSLRKNNIDGILMQTRLKNSTHKYKIKYTDFIINEEVIQRFDLAEVINHSLYLKLYINIGRFRQITIIE